MIHSNVKYFSKASVLLLLMLVGQVSYGQKNKLQSNSQVPRL